MAHSPCCEFPLIVPFSTYLAPSRCNRNGPPQSQVARKLIPFVPHCSLVPSPLNSQPFLGFPELNVHLIKATSQTLFPVYNTILFFNILSHSTFCHLMFCPIRCYFYSTFCPIRHYVSFGLYYFWHYVCSAFCPIQHFVRSTFCIIQHFVIRHCVLFDVLSFGVLYFWRLLLRHFISEPY